jgi:hypothetical protein
VGAQADELSGSAAGRKTHLPRRKAILPGYGFSSVMAGTRQISFACEMELEDVRRQLYPRRVHGFASVCRSNRGKSRG